MIDKIFNILGSNDGGKIFAKYLPRGIAWNNKNNVNSNLFKLLNSLTLEDNILRDVLNTIFTQFDVNETIDFIEEWEKQLGIPDDCFDTNVSIEQRRNQCVAKIKARGVQTANDLIDIIGILGYSATLTTRFDIDPSVDPSIGSYELIITFLDTTISTIFPVTYPWFFGENGYLLNIECFIKKLIPSTCTVSFGRTNAPLFQLTMQNDDIFLLQDNDMLITN